MECWGAVETQTTALTNGEDPAPTINIQSLMSAQLTANRLRGSFGEQGVRLTRGRPVVQIPPDNDNIIIIIMSVFLERFAM